MTEFGLLYRASKSPPPGGLYLNCIDCFFKYLGFLLQVDSLGFHCFLQGHDLPQIHSHLKSGLLHLRNHNFVGHGSCYSLLLLHNSYNLNYL